MMKNSNLQGVEVIINLNNYNGKSKITSISLFRTEVGGAKGEQLIKTVTCNLTESIITNFKILDDKIEDLELGKTYKYRIIPYNSFWKPCYFL